MGKSRMGFVDGEALERATRAPEPLIIAAPTDGEREMVLGRAQVQEAAQAQAEAHDALMKRVIPGMKRLTLNGGQGDEKSALVDGQVITVKESAALAIARDIIDDAERRTGKTVHDIPFLELMTGIDARAAAARVADVTAAQIGAELARLQNTAIYGDKIRRR